MGHGAPGGAALGAGPGGAHTGMEEMHPWRRGCLLGLSRNSGVDFPGQGNSESTSPSWKNGGVTGQRDEGLEGAQGASWGKGSTSPFLILGARCSPFPQSPCIPSTRWLSEKNTSQ